VKESHDELFFGGLAAVCVAVMTQLVDKPTPLVTPLGGCVICFALAIPLLVCSLLVTKATRARRTRLRNMADMAGVLIAVLGFVFLFLHINVTAGVVFAGAIAFAIVLFIFTAKPEA
jgi:threonine/homoserine/homoserine lactone efflux protein